MIAPLKILVVANPGDQAELVSLLRTAGAPLADARLVIGDGDDATFGRFEAEAPAIAVVGATLERGDASALIGAMRGAAPAGLFVVVIGDAHGPVLNALDAIELGADRFVGRPLTIKALRFAVMGGVGPEHRAGSGPVISPGALADSARSAPVTRPAMVSAPVVVPVVPVVPVVAAAPVAMDDAVTAPVRVSELRARWEALAEEIEELPDDELDDRPTLRNVRTVTAPMDAVADELVATLAAPGDGSAPAPSAATPGDGVSAQTSAPAAALADADSGAIALVEEDAFEVIPVGDGDVVESVDEASVVAPPEELGIPAGGLADDDSGPELIFDGEAPAVIAVHETASVALIADGEAWPPPELSSRLAAVATEPPPLAPASMASNEPAEASSEPVVASSEPVVASSEPVVTSSEPGEPAVTSPAPASPAGDDLWSDAPAPRPRPAVPAGDEPWSSPLSAAAEPSPADELWSDLPRRPVTAVAPADDLWSDTPVPPRPAAEEPWADGPSPRAATSPADRPGEPRPSRAATAPDDRWADSAPPRAGTAPPEPPAREPTLILTDDPPVPPPVPRAPLAAARMPRSVTIPPPPAPPPPPVAPAPAVRAPAVDDDEFADDFDDGAELGSAEGFHGDGFERDEPVTDGGAPGTPRPAEPPPAGGEFARELRRKMSAMAERLFRGEVPPVPVASGPGHDHHTEIDLGGLDEETPLPAAALTDDLGGATYVGELPAPDPAPDARATDGRGTAEVGELRRGTADVPALVARMFAQSFTGRVVFRRGPVEKAVHFDGGRPVFATSNQAHDRMGELLHREGKITREQHDRCRELVRDTGRRMGEILVERGYLKRRELLPAVRRHIEDIIYSLFAWDAGEYRVVAGDGASGERIRLSRHAAALVLEGVRRKLDHDLLEHLLGPPGTVVTIVDRDKLAAVTAVADLSREERAALAALDGLADLDQVARASGAGLEAVYQLAWSLSLLGLVAPRRRVDDDAEAGALIGESDLRIDRERVRARCELCGDADYFSLLGVRRDATGFEIRRAYEAARRDFAPESFPPELRRELAADLDDIAVVLDEAYRVLREDPLRSAYRGHLQDLDPT